MELLNLEDSRLAAMDATGIDVQVVSLTMPGREGFDGETAITMAAEPTTSCPRRCRRIRIAWQV
jgi:hypothetical protein